MSSNRKKITASIVTYNSAGVIEDTVRSILEQTRGRELTLYISDNSSTDGTAELVSIKFPSVIVLKNSGNHGFGWGHNRVLNLLTPDTSDYHAIINPDISLFEDTLGKLADYMDNHPDIALITPKIQNPDGSEQFLPKKKPRPKYLLGGKLERFGGVFERLRAEYTMRGEDLSKGTEIEFCTGCFMFARTQPLLKMGGFDERFFLYFEDVDLAQRLKQFGRVVFWPGTAATHAWDRASSRKLKYFVIQLRSMLRFFEKWGWR